MPRLAFCVLVVIPVSIVTAESSPEPVFQESTLFKSRTGGYHTYRIPSLIVTNKGTVLAFAEARKKSASDHGDVDLAIRRSSDGGRTWTDMKIIADDGDHTMGNPCPVVDRKSGTIWLPLCRDNKTVLMMYSRDDGKSWSRPVDITKHAKNADWHWVGTGPGHGIQLKSGRLLIPCWADATPKLGEIQLSYAFYSDDAGKTWKCGQPLDIGASDECEAVELADGRLYMTARSRNNKRLKGYAFSKDGGETWSTVKYDKRLPEPSCQGSAIRYKLPDSDHPGRILLSTPGNPKARTHMTVHMSTDECKSWQVSKVVHQGSSAYSDLAVTKGGEILLLYEADGYSTLTLARFNLSWLEHK